jgi:hypothetical protein
MNNKTQIMNSMKIILITLVGIALLAFRCRDCHDEVKIINNSGNAIYFDFSYRYPDTIPVANPVPGRKYAKIGAHSYGIDNIYDNCFDADSFGTVYMYYIYDAQMLETTPWDTVVKYYMILKRYDVTFDDLDRMNWTITYP